MTAILLATVLAANGPVDTVVVCPEAFREALEPWVQYRTEQGHVLKIVSNADGPEEIRRRICEVAQDGRVRFVVLVGDAHPGVEADAEQWARCVPVRYARAEVNVLWGSEPHIATDNWYGDLDDDPFDPPVPEAAVGRLPADTPEELATMVEKILAYERSTDLGPWRRRLNIVAGVGGFSPLTDLLLESVVRRLINHDVPAGFKTSMTYASWRSPYCPDPRLFHDTTLQRLNEGSWFWVYIGHGHPFGLDPVRVPQGQYPILDTSDVARMQCRRPPIALFLACYTGAIDARDDCLGESMVCAPGGPVAVIAGSRVTMPYAMTLLTTGLLNQVFEYHCPTLGEALLHAKQQMVAETDQSDTRRVLIDRVAAAVSPEPKKLPVEREEHLLLLNLLGDPLLRLRHPKQVRLNVASTAIAGGRLTVAGTTPVGGRCVVELVVRRDRLAFRPPVRREYPQSSVELAQFQEVYRKANDGRLSTVELPLAPGPFRVALNVPSEANGPCHVRVFVEGKEDFALGAADVEAKGAPQVAARRQPLVGLRWRLRR